ncbi:hypothetical protein M3689_14880 [Alkalihalophilus marmarensis]|uniref:hypothetical protein n=1 Tax=Alkalihalophilus marmarensis TaxID=521377 RepID=UPI00203B5544|nr:hypothetical protein [Alkalihalophilus marmarensis]MCM3490598.1 hypothetical protein [Alkalihalophilus marmarensis]
MIFRKLVCLIILLVSLTGIVIFFLQQNLLFFLLNSMVFLATYAFTIRKVLLSEKGILLKGKDGKTKSYVINISILISGVMFLVYDFTFIAFIPVLILGIFFETNMYFNELRVSTKPRM